MSQGAIRGPAILGYGVALLAVGIAAIGLAAMEARWQDAPHVVVLLTAVIVTTRIAGARPGLLATALAVAAYAYFQLYLPEPQAAQAIPIIRLVSIALISCYVVWLTATERARADSLRSALDEVRLSNEALRAENLERKRTEEAVRRSERVLLEAEELGRTGSWEHDLVSGAIYNTPENLRLFFGDDRSKGARFEDYAEAIHPDDRAYVTARRGQLLDQDGPRDIEFRVVWPDGTVHTLVGRAAVVRDASGRPVRTYGTNVDITERKSAEQAMRESQSLLNLVLETLPVGVAVVDRAGDIILSNAASRRIWGQSLIHSGSERWARSAGYWHGSGKRVRAAEWPSALALRDGRTTLNELIDIDAFDGLHKTIECSAAPIRNSEGSIVGAVFVIDEVTERVHADKALQDSAGRLQQLSRRLLAVQEEERRHLSRELHDEFGQLLATVTLHLQTAKTAAGPAAQQSLSESIALLQEAGTQVRRLALELRPMLLETAGLDATLRWLAKQHEQRTGIGTEVIGHVGEISGDVEVACFRVVQEALTNVVRHAAARRVWIELSQSEELLGLVIRDDGVGFDVSRTLEGAADDGSLGLAGMRERVEILGGTLVIDSRPGHGTRIEVSFPLTEPAAAPVRETA